MKQADDVLTMELPLVRKRGPRVSGKARSNAERQAAYRARRVSVDLGERMAATVRTLAEDFELDPNQVVRELVRHALLTRNWKVTGFPGIDE